MNLGKQFKDGMLTQNPVLVQVLGMCSTMAITTSFFNGIGMGVAVTIILTLSNVIISAMRKIIPDKIRIAMFIVVIAGFVTCVDLSIQAFLPDLANSLGVFIPLIVVNCIILGRAEAFSYKNGMVASFFDGIFQGSGYTWLFVVYTILLFCAFVSTSVTLVYSMIQRFEGHCFPKAIKSKALRSVIVGLVVLLVIAMWNMPKKETTK